MSEQRMTEIVEMLVERITSMEVCISSLTESIDVVKARVLSQDSTLQILKHTVDAVARRQRRDITGRECAPKGMICGINGRAVDLQIHHGLDTATTVSGEADDVIIVMSDTPLGHPPDSDRERVWESVMPWKWDADVRAAWGNAKYTRVRTECARLYRDKGGGFRPSCAELGLAAPLCGVQSGHHHLDDELHECLSRSRFLVEIGCDTPNEREGVKCLRGKVADLVKTSAKARVAVKEVMDLARSGYIEQQTVMAEYAKSYPNEYLTDPLPLCAERFAHIIRTQNIMADSIDFQMMDNWLSKFGVSLINITRQNAGSSSNLIQMLQGGGNPASRGESVICISTDNVHYNWVLFKYRSRSTVESEVVINRTCSSICSLQGTRRS
ncbi:MAG: hypothetical protein WDW38_006390 [Sanguina aurantia]